METSAKATFSPPSSQRAGFYRMVRVLGRGGLGRVFLAVDDRTGERVALKLVESAGADPIARRRLAREYKALKTLSHPNVVRVIDAGLAEATPYLVLEYVAGLSLRTWLDGVTVDEPLTEESAPAPSFSGDSQDLPAWVSSALEEQDTGALPRVGRALSAEQIGALNHPARLARLRDAVGQIARGLAYIHEQGLVHRDVKPGNILVDQRRQVKLLDFGLVKSLGEDSQVTMVGRIVGTYLYMSPEQARGKKVDGRADLYSLGAVIYEMATGSVPVCATNAGELIEQIVRVVPRPVLELNPGADPTLARVAEKLLEKDPDERHQSAGEVLRELGA